jgi:hypothetical protein
MSDAPLSVAAIFGAAGVIGGLLFGQPWKAALGQGAFVFVAALGTLLVRHRVRARSGIERDRAARLAT